VVIYLAKENGWWTLKTTVKPAQTDLDNIAKLIAEGFTCGEIIEDEL